MLAFLPFISPQKKEKDLHVHGVTWRPHRVHSPRHWKCRECALEETLTRSMGLITSGMRFRLDPRSPALPVLSERWAHSLDVFLGRFSRCLTHGETNDHDTSRTSPQKQKTAVHTSRRVPNCGLRFACRYSRKGRALEKWCLKRYAIAAGKTRPTAPEHFANAEPVRRCGDLKKNAKVTVILCRNRQTRPTALEDEHTAHRKRS